MTDIEAQFQELIQAAKAHKAELDMAKLEYKHTMRKVGILAEQYPAMAQKLGLTAPKKDKSDSGSEE
jgi:hypothetical protein